ncbi:hypothetical protein ACWF5H_09325 [Arthrobacter sp. NPDC055138]
MLIALLWLFVALVTGSGVDVSLFVFILVLFSWVPLRLAARRKSIRRIEEAVNNALAQDLQSHLRITRKESHRLHSLAGTEIQEGNQTYKFVPEQPKPGITGSQPSSSSHAVTITVMHGDLGLSAYEDMVKAVLRSP